MGIKNQSGQALAEFVIACLFFMTLLIVIEKLIQTRKVQSNKYKVSKEYSPSAKDTSLSAKEYSPSAKKYSLSTKEIKKIGEAYE